MAENPTQTHTPTQPQALQPQQSPQNMQVPKPESAPKSQEEIIKHLGSIKPEVKPEVEFIKTSLDDIKDPQSRSFVEQRIKDLESGYNKKFMDLANQRKEVEKLRDEFSNITPQRLQEMLKRPDFIQSAQFLQQTAPPASFEGSQEQWSSLTDQERKMLAGADQRAKQTEAQLNQILRFQVHQKIQSRYPDYDSNATENFLNEAMQGKISDEQLYEMIHRGINFERYVSNAMKYGKEDMAQLNHDRANGSSPSGMDTTTQADKPKMTTGERPGDFFKRIAKWNLQNIGSQSKK